MTTLQTPVSLDLIISVSAIVVGVVGVYVRLKSKIEVLETTCQIQEKEIVSLKDDNKKIEGDFSLLQKEVAQNHNKLDASMAQMELRIIREFHSVIAQAINQKDKP